MAMGLVMVGYYQSIKRNVAVVVEKGDEEYAPAQGKASGKLDCSRWWRGL